MKTDKYLMCITHDQFIPIRIGYNYYTDSFAVTLLYLAVSLHWVQLLQLCRFYVFWVELGLKFFTDCPACHERSAALRCHIVVLFSGQRRSFQLLSLSADSAVCEEGRHCFSDIIWNTTKTSSHCESFQTAGGAVGYVLYFIFVI